MPIRVNFVQDRIKKALDTREEKHRPFIGKIVSVNGSIFPPNRPNFVWVSEYNQPESRVPVFNDAVLPVEGLNVWVVETPKPPFRLQVLRVYTGGLPENHQGGAHRFNTPAHGVTHQIPSEANAGDDPVLVYQPALQPLKTTGNSISLTVTVQEYRYHINGSPQLFGGGVADLTGYVPGAGLVRRVLVYLNTTTNTLAIKSGTAVPNTGVSIPYPSIPARAIPSAFVRLANGQTTVTTSTDIVDARDFMGANAVAGEPYLATAAGQVLYSEDGVTFRPRLPLVNDWGWMQNDQGLLLVV